MREQLKNMLTNIKSDIIFMANEVENALHLALKALEQQDKDLAKTVSKGDKKINLTEVKIEQNIMSLMALQQPVAVDLRFMLVALKMNNDLERIGDHAKSIAKIAKHLVGEPYIKSATKIPEFGKECKNMLHDAVQAFINLDTELAVEIKKRDKMIDKKFGEIYEDIITEISTDKNNIRQAIELVSVLRNLERVADLAANFGEDVVFMKDAKIIRYGVDKKQDIIN